MSNLDESIELENRLQPVMLQHYYTVIGPANWDEFGRFMQLANQNIDGFDIHQVLGNRAEIRNLLRGLNYGNDLRIYIIYDRDTQILLHDTVEGYLEHNNINFQLYPTKELSEHGFFLLFLILLVGLL